MAKEHELQSLTGESGLRPVVSPNSTLTAVGDRHLRQRKMLLPPFHGEAIARHEQMISDTAERAIDRWPVGRPISLAPRMQAITLDVIMAGIFGIEGTPGRGTPEFWLREATRSIIYASTLPFAQLAELMNVGRDEPVGIQKVALGLLDKPAYELLTLVLAGHETTAASCSSTTARTSTPTPSRSARSAGSATSRAPTSGSRSAAASGAAWARRWR